jgi:hypothetical protein
VNDRLRKFMENVKVVPMDEYLKAIEAGQPLICMPGIGFEFPDDMHGRCELCRCLIHFRPYNQTATVKICILCAPKLNGEVS